MKYRNIDLYLVISTAALTLFSGYMLFLDRFSHDFAKKEILPIATIKTQANTVKKKNYDFIAWIDASIGDQLANNDLVYTYDQSNAQISFQNGTEIRLAENTLVKIGQEQEETKLDIQRGVVLTKIKSPKARLKLSVGKKKYNVQLDNAELQIVKGEKKSSISLVKGKAEIKSDKGQTVAKIQKNQVLEFSAREKIEKVKELKIILLAPKSHLKIPRPFERPLLFNWKIDQKQEVVFLLATDMAFSKIVLREETDRNFISMHELPYGDYFWKVVSVDGKNESLFQPFSVVRKQTPIEDKPKQYVNPVLSTKPENGKDLLVHSPDQKLNFQWVLQSKQYPVQFFELSSTRDFKKVRKTIKTTTNSISTNITKQGVHYWRIRLQKQDGTIEFSPVQKIKISPPPPPEKPELIPEVQDTIKLQEKVLETSYLEKLIDLILPAAHANDKRVKFAEIKWKAHKQASQYQLEIFSDEDLTDKVLSKKTSNSSYEWINPKPGKYFWRIAIVDSWGQVGEFSKASPLNIKDLKKLVVPKQNYPKHRKVIDTQKNPITKFSWKDDNEEDVTYEILFSKTLDFKKPIYRKSLKRKSIKINLKRIKSKQFYWRVKAISSSNKIKKSKRRKLILTSPVVVAKKEQRSRKRISVRKKEPQQSFITIGVIPSMTKYEQQANDFSAEIDGNVLNALTLNARYNFSTNYFADLRFLHQSGEVFNGLDYSNYSLSPTLGRNIYQKLDHQVNAKLGVFQRTFRNHSLATSTTLQNSSKNLIAPIVKVEYAHQTTDKLSNNITVGLGFGSIDVISAEYLLSYRIQKRYLFITGLGFLKNSTTIDNTQLEISETFFTAQFGQFF